MSFGGNKYIEFTNEIPMFIYGVALKQSYREYRPYNTKQFINLKAFKEYVDENFESSVFEVVSTPIHKIFLDLENIPDDKPELYSEITQKFFEYSGIDSEITPYLITKNVGSRHGGLSYHVIIGVLSTMDNIKNLIRNFVKDNEEYAQYVDASIYSRNRLFRLPEQTGIVDRARIVGKSYVASEDCHHILSIHNFDEEEAFALSVIQHITHPKYVHYSRVWKPVDTKHMPETRAEESANFGTLIRMYNAITWVFKNVKGWFA